jgi:hypothetical protein
MRVKKLTRESAIGYKRSTTKSLTIKCRTDEVPKISKVQKDHPRLHYRNQKSVIVSVKHPIFKNNQILKQCTYKNELDKFVLSI